MVLDRHVHDEAGDTSLQVDFGNVGAKGRVRISIIWCQFPPSQGQGTSNDTFGLWDKVVSLRLADQSPDRAIGLPVSMEHDHKVSRADHQDLLGLMMNEESLISDPLQEGRHIEGLIIHCSDFVVADGPEEELGTFVDDCLGFNGA